MWEGELTLTSQKSGIPPQEPPYDSSGVELSTDQSDLPLFPPTPPGTACSRATLHTKLSSIPPIKVLQALTSAFLRTLLFTHPL